MHVLHVVWLSGSHLSPIPRLFLHMYTKSIEKWSRDDEHSTFMDIGRHSLL